MLEAGMVGEVAKEMGLAASGSSAIEDMFDSGIDDLMGKSLLGEREIEALLLLPLPNGFGDGDGVGGLAVEALPHGTAPHVSAEPLLLDQGGVAPAALGDDEAHALYNYV